jgi:hypothetical protein
MQTELEDRFQAAVERACAESTSIGYLPAYLLQKMHQVGAVKYSKQLVISGEMQSGIQRLARFNRLDLSLEYLVARVPAFASLFSKSERDAAEWRLAQAEAKSPAKKPSKSDGKPKK